MLGEKLIEFRKIKGYSQQEVADLIDVSRQTISNWESNQGAPTIEKAKQLAELYQISLDDLVGSDVEVMTKHKSISSLFKHIIGKECSIEYGDNEDIFCRHEHLLVLDVDEDWVKIQFQQTKEGTFNKKEEAIGFIELSKVKGFRFSDKEEKL